MKKFTYILLSAAMVAFAASCARIDHAEGLRVTYYPVIELQGGATVAHQVGTPWVDPGYSATLEGKDVTSELEIDGSVDVTKSGIYSLTYSFTNEDGFEKSAGRTVVVYDKANANTLDISGEYEPEVLLFNLSDNQPYGRMRTIVRTITPGPATGLFYIQDLFGGFYEAVQGYGSVCAAKALVLLNADNSISLLSFSLPGWSTSQIVLHNPAVTKYDPETGNVTIDFFWSMFGEQYIVTTYKK